MNLIEIFNRVKDKARTLYERFQAHAAAVHAEQQAFQDSLSAAADVIGIENVDRLMSGKAPIYPVNVWPEIEARNEARRLAAEKADAARKTRGPWITFAPYKGSPREAQENFNKIANAYVAKYGITAFEEAMKPPRPPRQPGFQRPPDTFN